jgi:hypothetical protein
MNTDQVQFLISRQAGTEAVANAALNVIIQSQGSNAKVFLTAMMEALVSRVKNSDIIPEREMDHVMIVGPALEEIQRILTAAIHSID